MHLRRPGDKPLSQPVMVTLLTRICITRPQWVNNRYESKLIHVLPRGIFHNQKSVAKHICCNKCLNIANKTCKDQLKISLSYHELKLPHWKSYVGGESFLLHKFHIGRDSLSFRNQDMFVNSFRPSEAIWQQRFGSTLAQVMACCLTGTNSLPVPMLTYHQ